MGIFIFVILVLIAIVILNRKGVLDDSEFAVAVVILLSAIACFIGVTQY